MKEFSRIAVDLAKGFFQVHAIAREGSPGVTRKLSRAKFLGFFADRAVPYWDGGLRIGAPLGA